MNFVFELQRYNNILKFPNNLGKITKHVTFLIYFCYLCSCYGADKREVREI